jgi:hypothetical protein
MEATMSSPEIRRQALQALQQMDDDELVRMCEWVFGERDRAGATRRVMKRHDAEPGDHPTLAYQVGGYEITLRHM